MSSSKIYFLMFEALSYVGIAGNEDDGHTQQSKRELKKKKTNEQPNLL
jgi:hypothetical protein